jgi:hypothetical protein
MYIGNEIFSWNLSQSLESLYYRNAPIFVFFNTFDIQDIMGYHQCEFINGLPTYPLNDYEISNIKVCIKIGLLSNLEIVVPNPYFVAINSESVINRIRGIIIVNIAGIKGITDKK